MLTMLLSSHHDTHHSLLQLPLIMRIHQGGTRTKVATALSVPLPLLDGQGQFIETPPDQPHPYHHHLVLSSLHPITLSHYNAIYHPDYGIILQVSVDKLVYACGLAIPSATIPNISHHNSFTPTTYRIL